VIELELELIQTDMTQTPVLRVEVGARLCAQIRDVRWYKKSQKNTHAAADSGLNFSIFEVLLLDSDVFILGLDLERE
jgi:hypothetical protein